METKNLKKSNVLTTLFLSIVLMVMGCGQAGMEANWEENFPKAREVQIPVSTVLSHALSEGVVSSEDVAEVEESLVEKLIDVRGESNGDLHLSLCKTNVLVKPNEDVTDDPQDVAFTINGIEVTNEMASDPETLQYLLASSSLLEPDSEGGEESSSHHIGMGQKLVRGDTKKKVVSNLLGLIIRSVLGFTSLDSADGALASALISPLFLEPQEGGQSPSHGESQNNGSQAPHPSSGSHDRFHASEGLQESVEKRLNGNPNNQTKQTNQSPGTPLKETEQGVSGKSNKATNKKPKQGFFKTVIENIKELGRDFIAWVKGLFKAKKKPKKPSAKDSRGKAQLNSLNPTQNNNFNNNSNSVGLRNTAPIQRNRPQPPVSRPPQKRPPISISLKVPPQKGQSVSSSFQVSGAGGGSGTGGGSGAGPNSGSNPNADSGPCKNGFVLVPGNSDYHTDDFCVMKYEAKAVDEDGNHSEFGCNTSLCLYPKDALLIDEWKASSVADNKPWVRLDRAQAVKACRASKLELLTNDHWQTIARNIESVDENWANNTRGDAGGLNRGHSNALHYLFHDAKRASTDNNPCSGTVQDATDCSVDIWHVNRRTHKLSNDQVIWDIAGNVWEWVSEDNSTNYGGIHYITELTDDDAKIRFGPSGDYSASLGNAPPYGNLGKLHPGTLGGVIRGGDGSSKWSSGVFAAFLYVRPSNRSKHVGFRCFYPAE